MASSTSADKPTVAFFGATGGCSNATLALALKNGHSCSALARTPPKLVEMLSAQNVAESTITSQLRIVKGDVKDISAVKEVLTHGDGVADIIVFGIGMIVGKIEDPKICTNATQNIITALTDLKPAKKPYFANISSTGISSGPRDVPVLLLPIYYGMLRTPHADKRIVEDLIQKNAQVFDGFTILRPTLLTSGKVKGVKNVKVGTEQKPALGYTISRGDVGTWIFEKLVIGNKSRWNGEKVTLTY